MDYRFMITNILVFDILLVDVTFLTVMFPVEQCGIVESGN